MLPSKTSAQIRTHSQNFFVKVERVANSVDALEYVKSKPTDVFMLPPFGYPQKKDKKLRTGGCKTYECRFRNDIDEPPTKMKKVESEAQVGDSSLTHILAGDVRILSKPSERIAGKLRTQGRHRRRSSDSSSLERSRSPRHRRHRHREEEKLPMMAPYPPPIYPRMDPYTSEHLAVQNNFAVLLADMRRLTGKLETEYADVNEMQKTDADLGNYWRALHDCAVSLQHVVNDVSYIHINSYQQPMQYAPMAYYQPAVRPYYPEHL
ncbi:MAG: hypothetical protein P4M11_13945 [Candidatus Pacebacteria bacterium]|nr:hypothetical protein [Candidatus Paceibacterota bacterium]